MPLEMALYPSSSPGALSAVKMGSVCWNLALILVFFFWGVATLISAQDAVPAFDRDMKALPDSGQERLSLDRGWRFHLGDIPFPVITGQKDSYANAKAGKAWGAAAPEFDDTDWRQLDLPHDWVVEGPFDPQANLSQGYRPRGISWYRRSFRLPLADKGKDFEIQFDGVATFCTVWVNGILAARNWCGYTGFHIDMTSFARFGNQINTIAVRVDANATEGWWYEGGGIYRHTWLLRRDPVHIITDGVDADPVQDAAGKWSVPMEVTLTNSSRTSERVDAESVLLDSSGNEIARGTGGGDVNPFDEVPAKYTLAVEAPHLWSVDDPFLYRVRTTVRVKGREVDSLTTSCGFRTLRFDAGKGFFLNGQPLKIHGVCDHIGHAGVGVAVPDSLWDFRLRKLKEMGVNAVRCAHDPPAIEFLDACDRLGLLVMDENRNFNPTPEYLGQLEWMVRRDRNHPSIILWSIFNEEPMQGTEAGYEMARRMAAAVKRLDTSRPVTAAMSGGLLGGINVSDAVDVVGFNYQQGNYDKYHQAHPERPMTSSEDTSAFMTRGIWFNDEARHYKSSYDTERAPWGETHREGWKAIDDRPFVAGDFIWTGFDYRGEPTPYKWPSVSSYFGCLDLCGFPKMAFYLHQSQWVEDHPVLTLVPHWNWAGREGQPIKVVALTNADSVELSLNGKVVSEQKVDKGTMPTWEVPYAPGKLEAVAKKDGREVARAVVETTGPVVALKVIPDRPNVAGDGRDALPFTIEAVDSQGRVVPTADFPARFEIQGPGRIIGLGNGDPTCHEPEKGDAHSLFNGLAQVIVQTNARGAGPLVLKANSPGLASAEATIQVNAAAEPPFVPIIALEFSPANWSMSPISKIRPDPNQRSADNDMNSWSAVQLERLPVFVDGGFALLRAQFSPYASIQHDGGTVVFRQLCGPAEVWLDGRLLGKKTDSGTRDFSLPFPAGKSNSALVLVIQAQAGQSAGPSGGVVIEHKSGL